MIAIVCTGVLCSAIVACAPARADGPSGSVPSSVANELMARDLVGVSGKELLMLTVEYVPGGASLPHRHNSQVFVYVLEGSIRMQIKGSPAVTLGPGKTFYEGPDDIHTVSANASDTKPAKILVFMVKDKGAPVSSPISPQEHP
jgi:quercetin dioxygenase-like cupin family protein